MKDQSWILQTYFFSWLLLQLTSIQKSQKIKGKVIIGVSYIRSTVKSPFVQFYLVKCRYYSSCGNYSRADTNSEFTVSVILKLQKITQTLIYKFTMQVAFHLYFVKGFCFFVRLHFRLLLKKDHITRTLHWNWWVHKGSG